MGEIRIGTIGTNFIVEWFLEAVASCETIRWAAAYSRSLEKGKEFVGDAIGVTVYDSLADMAASTDIDAVYIGSPTSCHAEQAIMMLKSGKHVLCEKPVASNYKEWQAMQLAATTSGTILLEAMRPVHAPAYKIVSDNLYKIGTVRRAEFHFCQYSSRYDNFKKGIIENAFRPELSNGALMDLGVYCIESMVGLFGAPQRVRSESYILPDSIDGTGSIIAEYEGLLATIGYSKISTSNRGCELQGEAGTLTYDNIATPTNVQITYRDKSKEVLFGMTEKSDMIYEIQAFAQMIASGKIVAKYHDITAESLKIMDKVRADCGILFAVD